MEQKYKAIIIQSKDLREKDRQVVFFTLEKGKITAVLKGVKSPNAKFKHLNLFTFGECILSSDKDYATVTSFEVIESFYELTKNPDVFLEACSILEILNIVVQASEPATGIFLQTLHALKTLAYNENEQSEPEMLNRCHPETDLPDGHSKDFSANLNNSEKRSNSVEKNYVLVKFLIYIFENLGYKLSLDKCAVCRGNFIGKKFLTESGEIVCLACKTPDAVLISPAVHSALKHLSVCDWEKLNTLHLATGSADEAGKILNANFERRFGRKLKI